MGVYSKPKKIKYVFGLDPGHGKATQGKRSPVWDDGTQLLEWEFNRDVAVMLYDFLTAEDIPCSILVPGDEDPSLSDRVKACHALADQSVYYDKYTCDDYIFKPVMISIHGNAASAESAKGIEIFTSRGRTLSDDLAQELLISMMRGKLGRECHGRKFRIGMEDGDLDKEVDYFVLRKTNCPAVIIEYGFFTNYEECQLMLTEDYRRACAIDTFRGINSFIFQFETDDYA